MHIHDLKLRCGSVRVLEAGSGPPLLLLHGGLGDARTHWETASEELSHVFRLYAPCLPSYPGSDALDHPSWAGLTDWLNGILDGLGLDRVPICGNSFGGALAQAFAARFPERVSHLLLVNSGPLISVPAFAAALLKSPLGKPLNRLVNKVMYSKTMLSKTIAEPRVLSEAFIDSVFEHAPLFSSLMSQVAASKAPAIVPSDLPVTVIWGDTDWLMPEKAARKLAGTYKNASLRRVEGVGHMPQLEAPVRFALIVREVLGQSPAA